MTIHTHRTRLRGAALAAVAATTLLVAACGDTGDDATASSTTAAELAPAQRWNPGDATETTDPADTTPATSTGVPTSGFAGVDMTNAAAVARKAMEVWYTWDTTIETGPNDAVANTVPLLTPDYAEQITSGAPQGGPGGTWLLWAEKKVHTAVDVRDVAAGGGTDAGPTQAAGDRSYFEYNVVQTPLDPAGRPAGAPVVNHVGVLCTHTDDGGWGVSAVQPL